VKNGIDIQDVKLNKIFLCPHESTRSNKNHSHTLTTVGSTCRISHDGFISEHCYTTEHDHILLCLTISNYRAYHRRSRWPT